MLREFLSFFLLSAFVLLNITISLWRLFGRFTGITLRKSLGLNLPENEKKSWERLFTVVWLFVGIWAFFKLWSWSVTGIMSAIFGFLAFRSGANVTKALVYSLHDREIVKEHSRDSRALSIIGTATGLSLLLEGLFIFSFALAYKVLSTTLNSGTRVNFFILILWIGGLIFGLVFGWFIAKNNRGILMENAISTVGFFATKKGKEKGEEATKKVKSVGGKLRRR
ncbi:hypothetical protein [Thermococcus sp.]